MGKLISQAWRLAALNLQRNRRRSLLSISIIAIAVLALNICRRLWSLYL